MKITHCPPAPARGLALMNDGLTAQHRGNIWGTRESREPDPVLPSTCGSGFDVEEALARVFSELRPAVPK